MANEDGLYTNLGGGQWAKNVQLSGSKVAEGIADFRLNTEGTLLASAARTASTRTSTQTNYNAKSVIIYLDVTAVGASGGLILKVEGVDPTTGKTFNLNVDPAIITVIGKYAYVVGLGASGGGGAAQDVKQTTPLSLPRSWDVFVYHADATSYTYSVGYSLIL